MYQKEIIYMGLYKDGSRIGNAGFLKVENREEESRFQLKLQNIPECRSRSCCRTAICWKEKAKAPRSIRSTPA